MRLAIGCSRVMNNHAGFSNPQRFDAATANFEFQRIIRHRTANHMERLRDRQQSRLTRRGSISFVHDNYQQALNEAAAIEKAAAGFEVPASRLITR
jgi:hypothetical protein